MDELAQYSKMIELYKHDALKTYNIAPENLLEFIKSFKIINYTKQIVEYWPELVDYYDICIDFHKHIVYKSTVIHSKTELH